MDHWKAIPSGMYIYLPGPEGLQEEKPTRIEALDVIRGIAILGILAINIAGFAGPTGAALSPHVPRPGTFADEVAFAFSFVVFEGKMRALFAILFGASMLLLVERAQAAGGSGDKQQLSRLFWLMVFGYLHFLLFWWGDILFIYAVCGFAALALRHLPTSGLTAIVLILFGGWHVAGMVATVPSIATEEYVRIGAATPDERSAQADLEHYLMREAAQELREYRSGFSDQIAAKLHERPLYPARVTLFSFAEIVPMMLLGMVLYRTGFFTGGWPVHRMRQAAVIATGAGLFATLAVLAWVWPRDFPPVAMSAALYYWLAIPHMLMAVGYAALLVLAAPRLAQSHLGGRVAAVGQMAFSNYLCTTVLMTAIFYGWGLGLVGTVGAAEQWLFVGLGWMLMLAWSKPWLAHFRRGPLEWAWRSLARSQWIRNMR